MTNTTDDTERPYRSWLVDDLWRLAKDNHGDRSLQLDLLNELRHRNTRWAGYVRLKVFERIVELVSQSFKWPTTDAPEAYVELPDEVFRYKTSPLRFLGYHVGRNGLDVKSRREILDFVYLKELSPINSPNYMLDWGHPRTGPRLRKMAESIATHTRNKKRQDTAFFALAIRQWESDLDYLKRKYYDGRYDRYDFVWPSTALWVSC